MGKKRHISVPRTYIVLGQREDGKYLGYEGGFLCSTETQGYTYAVTSEQFGRYTGKNGCRPMKRWKTLFGGFASFRQSRKGEPGYPSDNKPAMYASSANQRAWFKARSFAETLNRQNYMNLKWKAYRAGAKSCPVKVHTGWMMEKLARTSPERVAVYREQLPFEKKDI